MGQEIILSLQGMTKRYPGVVANHDICLDIRKGEVHTLVGENGAGKSTLIKCLSGAVIPDEGKIIWKGQEYSAMNPRLSRDLGIRIVYQELCLVDSLTVAENICLGEKKGNVVDYHYYNEVAKAAFERMGVSLDPEKYVGDLTTAQQQLVEIAKAISRGVELLILDEPTAPLTVEEIEGLFKVMSKLKADGVTMIYISHRMDEIFRVSDRITVLRDGESVKTLNMADTSRSELISYMVGRQLTENFPERTFQSAEKMLEVEHVYGMGDCDVSLYVKKGEIVGLAGLLGAGRTELARMIYGADPMQKGVVKLEGKKLCIKSPADGIAAGIGLIPEDRKHQGVLLSFGIDWNTSISCVKKLSRFGIMMFDQIAEVAQKYVNKLRIAAPSIKVKVESLSGGNQQKVVLAKTLATESKLLIFDEPTRGIDVGAKQEIYQLMADVVNEGKSILLISSDMEELLGMSDRIYVLAEGRIVGCLEKEEISQIKIMSLISEAMERS
ncbi:MAG: sugar ABC transporter ATP-binding protein [Lachnospiraceae bacterium]|nr:sugar ABC transporter ATP-binding protein [Lachnospiraceae bacterium]